jgi:hypothetical protein
MTRHAAYAAVLLSLAMWCARAPGLLAQAGATPDLSGYWELWPHGRFVPAARLALRVTPAMLEAEAQKTSKALRWCNWQGMPSTMDARRPLNIRQGAREVVIVAESPLMPVRHLYLDRTTHIDSDIFDPNTSGDSIAHWEGGTLVADTVGFDPGKGITEIPGGGFRTANAHLVERFRMVANGSILSVTFTWTDPSVFRFPHSYEFRYQRAEKEYEPRPYKSCDPFNPDHVTLFERP